MLARCRMMMSAAMAAANRPRGQRSAGLCPSTSQLIAANMPLTVESRLGPGDRVRVRFGSLAGIEGTVLSRRGEVRLVVCVDFLQQGASVEIDDFMLEPI